MKVIDVPIGNVHVGDRHRCDMGDMDALAANIREMGLLQPIGIDEYFNLIYGQRRLEACEELGWKKIPCVVVKLESALAGEYAENEFRKQFTPSERAAIGEAIEAELGKRERRGRPEKSSAIADDFNKGASVDIAAKRSGFRSTETYERAKTVVDHGAPELVAAMDAGEVSIDAAAKIASQPEEEQKRIVRMPADERKEIVRHIRKTKADREADERRAYDLRVFRGLAEAVERIAKHPATAAETWPGLSRVYAYDFGEHLHRAIAFLVRLEKEHPNAPRKPSVVA
jgi:ParB family chromosome partitioning protein